MRKWIVALAVFALSIGTLRAATDPHTIPVNLNVTNAFSISLDLTDITWTADPGTESSFEVIACEVRSNHGIEWTVTLQASPLTHTDGITEIAAENFRYAFTNDAPGTEVPAFTTDAEVPTSLTTIYTAAPSEYTVDFTGFGLGFRTIIPAIQKAGDYSTNLNITLADSF